MPSPKNPQDAANPEFDYHSLSLADLIRARDLYHLHLTNRKGAIGAAIGCYLIRNGDSWLGDRRKNQDLWTQEFSDRRGQALFLAMYSCLRQTMGCRNGDETKAFSPA